MSKDVYISPSMQTANAYAYGATTEEVQCNRIADALSAELTRCGITWLRGGREGSLRERCRESNAADCRVHLSIHTNAAGSAPQDYAEGCEVYHYRESEASKIACRPVYEELLRLGLRGRGLKSTNTVSWYEPENTAGTTVYVEVDFHDNPARAKWIIEHTEDVARAICKGLCGYLGKEYVEEKPTEPGRPEPDYRAMYFDIRDRIREIVG